MKDILLFGSFVCSDFLPISQTYEKGRLDSIWCFDSKSILQ